MIALAVGMALLGSLALAWFIGVMIRVDDNEAYGLDVVCGFLLAGALLAVGIGLGDYDSKEVRFVPLTTFVKACPVAAPVLEKGGAE